MDTTKIFDTICNCVSHVLDCDVGTLNEHSGFLVTFGWDSLAHVAIFCAVEKELEMCFSDQMIERLLTIGDYVNFVSQYKMGAN